MGSACSTSSNAFDANDAFLAPARRGGSVNTATAEAPFSSNKYSTLSSSSASSLGNIRDSSRFVGDRRHSNDNEDDELGTNGASAGPVDENEHMDEGSESRLTTDDELRDLTEEDIFGKRGKKKKKKKDGPLTEDKRFPFRKVAKEKNVAAAEAAKRRRGSLRAELYSKMYTGSTPPETSLSPPSLASSSFMPHSSTPFLVVGPSVVPISAPSASSSATPMILASGLPVPSTMQSVHALNGAGSMATLGQELFFALPQGGLGADFGGSAPSSLTLGPSRNVDDKNNSIYNDSNTDGDKKVTSSSSHQHGEKTTGLDLLEKDGGVNGERKNEEQHFQQHLRNPSENVYLETLSIPPQLMPPSLLSTSIQTSSTVPYPIAALPLIALPAALPLPTVPENVSPSTVHAGNVLIPGGEFEKIGVDPRLDGRRARFQRRQAAAVSAAVNASMTPEFKHFLASVTSLTHPQQTTLTTPQAIMTAGGAFSGQMANLVGEGAVVGGASSSYMNMTGGLNVMGTTNCQPILFGIGGAGLLPPTGLNFSYSHASVANSTTSAAAAAYGATNGTLYNISNSNTTSQTSNVTIPLSVPHVNFGFAANSPPAPLLSGEEQHQPSGKSILLNGSSMSAQVGVGVGGALGAPPTILFIPPLQCRANSINNHGAASASGSSSNTSSYSSGLRRASASSSATAKLIGRGFNFVTVETPKATRETALTTGTAEASRSRSLGGDGVLSIATSAAEGIACGENDDGRTAATSLSGESCSAEFSTALAASPPPVVCVHNVEGGERREEPTRTTAGAAANAGSTPRVMSASRLRARLPSSQSTTPTPQHNLIEERSAQKNSVVDIVIGQEGNTIVVTVDNTSTHSTVEDATTARRIAESSSLSPSPSPSAPVTPSSPLGSSSHNSHGVTRVLALTSPTNSLSGRLRPSQIQIQISQPQPQQQQGESEGVLGGEDGLRSFAPQVQTSMMSITTPSILSPTDTNGGQPHSGGGGAAPSTSRGDAPASAQAETVAVVPSVTVTARSQRLAVVSIVADSGDALSSSKGGSRPPSSSHLLAGGGGGGVLRRLSSGSAKGNTNNNFCENADPTQKGAAEDEGIKRCASIPGANWSLQSNMYSHQLQYPSAAALTCYTTNTSLPTGHSPRRAPVIAMLSPTALTPVGGDATHLEAASLPLRSPRSLSTNSTNPLGMGIPPLPPPLSSCIPLLSTITVPVPVPQPTRFVSFVVVDEREAIAKTQALNALLLDGAVIFDTKSPSSGQNEDKTEEQQQGKTNPTSLQLSSNSSNTSNTNAAVAAATARLRVLPPPSSILVRPDDKVREQALKKQLEDHNQHALKFQKEAREASIATSVAGANLSYGLEALTGMSGSLTPRHALTAMSTTNASSFSVAGATFNEGGFLGGGGGGGGGKSPRYLTVSGGGGGGGPDSSCSYISNSIFYNTNNSIVLAGARIEKDREGRMGEHDFDEDDDEDDDAARGVRMPTTLQGAIDVVGDAFGRSEIVISPVSSIIISPPPEEEGEEAIFGEGAVAVSTFMQIPSTITSPKALVGLKDMLATARKEKDSPKKRQGGKGGLLGSLDGEEEKEGFGVDPQRGIFIRGIANTTSPSLQPVTPRSLSPPPPMPLPLPSSRLAKLTLALLDTEGGIGDDTTDGNKPNSHSTINENEHTTTLSANSTSTLKSRGHTGYRGGAADDEEEEEKEEVGGVLVGSARRHLVLATTFVTDSADEDDSSNNAFDAAVAEGEFSTTGNSVMLATLDGLRGRRRIRHRDDTEVSSDSDHNNGEKERHRHHRLSSVLGSSALVIRTETALPTNFLSPPKVLAGESSPKKPPLGDDDDDYDYDNSKFGLDRNTNGYYLDHPVDAFGGEEDLTAGEEKTNSLTSGATANISRTAKQEREQREADATVKAMPNTANTTAANLDDDNDKTTKAKAEETLIGIRDDLLSEEDDCRNPFGGELAESFGHVGTANSEAGAAIGIGLLRLGVGGGDLPTFTNSTHSVRRKGKGTRDDPMTDTSDTVTTTPTASSTTLHTINNTNMHSTFTEAGSSVSVSTVTTTASMNTRAFTSSSGLPMCPPEMHQRQLHEHQEGKGPHFNYTSHSSSQYSTTSNSNENPSTNSASAHGERACINDNSELTRYVSGVVLPGVEYPVLSNGGTTDSFPLALDTQPPSVVGACSRGQSSLVSPTDTASSSFAAALGIVVPATAAFVPAPHMAHSNEPHVPYADKTDAPPQATQLQTQPLAGRRAPQSSAASSSIPSHVLFTASPMSPLARRESGSVNNANETNNTHATNTNTTNGSSSGNNTTVHTSAEQGPDGRTTRITLQSAYITGGGDLTSSDETSGPNSFAFSAPIATQACVAPTVGRTRSALTVGSATATDRRRGGGTNFHSTMDSSVVNHQYQQHQQPGDLALMSSPSRVRRGEDDTCTNDHIKIANGLPPMSGAVVSTGRLSLQSSKSPPTAGSSSSLTPLLAIPPFRKGSSASEDTPLSNPTGVLNPSDAGAGGQAYYSSSTVVGPPTIELSSVDNKIDTAPTCARSSGDTNSSGIGGSGRGLLGFKNFSARGGGSALSNSSSLSYPLTLTSTASAATIRGGSSVGVIVSAIMEGAEGGERATTKLANDEVRIQVLPRRGPNGGQQRAAGDGEDGMENKNEEDSEEASFLMLFKQEGHEARGGGTQLPPTKAAEATSNTNRHGEHTALATALTTAPVVLPALASPSRRAGSLSRSPSLSSSAFSSSSTSSSLLSTRSTSPSSCSQDPLSFLSPKAKNERRKRRTRGRTDKEQHLWDDATVGEDSGGTDDLRHNTSSGNGNEDTKETKRKSHVTLRSLRASHKVSRSACGGVDGEEVIGGGENSIKRRARDDANGNGADSDTSTNGLLDQNGLYRTAKNLKFAAPKISSDGRINNKTPRLGFVDPPPMPPPFLQTQQSPSESPFLGSSPCPSSTLSSAADLDVQHKPNSGTNPLLWDGTTMSLAATPPHDTPSPFSFTGNSSLTSRTPPNTNLLPQPHILLHHTAQRSEVGAAEATAAAEEEKSRHQPETYRGDIRSALTHVCIPTTTTTTTTNSNTTLEGGNNSKAKGGDDNDGGVIYLTVTEPSPTRTRGGGEGGGGGQVDTIGSSNNIKNPIGDSSSSSGGRAVVCVENSPRTPMEGNDAATRTVVATAAADAHKSLLPVTSPAKSPPITTPQRSPPLTFIEIQQQQFQAHSIRKLQQLQREEDERQQQQGGQVQEATASSSSASPSPPPFLPAFSCPQTSSLLEQQSQQCPHVAESATTAMVNGGDTTFFSPHQDGSGGDEASALIYKQLMMPLTSIAPQQAAANDEKLMGTRATTPPDSKSHGIHQQNKQQQQLFMPPSSPTSIFTTNNTDNTNNTNNSKAPSPSPSSPSSTNCAAAAAALSVSVSYHVSGEPVAYLTEEVERELARRSDRRRKAAALRAAIAAQIARDERRRRRRSGSNSSHSSGVHVSSSSEDGSWDEEGDEENTSGNNYNTNEEGEEEEGTTTTTRNSNNRNSSATKKISSDKDKWEDDAHPFMKPAFVLISSEQQQKQQQQQGGTAAANNNNNNYESGNVISGNGSNKKGKQQIDVGGSKANNNINNGSPRPQHQNSHKWDIEGGGSSGGGGGSRGGSASLSLADRISSFFK